MYISKDKLPKLLVKCEWQQGVAFAFSSSFDRILDTYITNMCDLIIFREEYLSPFRRHSNIYG